MKKTKKKYYLTKLAKPGFWHYVGDPLHPNTTMDTGIIAVYNEDIRVDEFGSYVEYKIDKTMNKQQEEKKQENCCCISYKRGITPCMCGCHKMFDAEEENQKLPSEVFMENCEIDVTGWEALLKLLDHLAKKNNWKI